MFIDAMTQWREPQPDEVVEIETRNYYHVGASGAHIPEARKAILRVSARVHGNSITRNVLVCVKCDLFTFDAFPAFYTPRHALWQR